MKKLTYKKAGVDIQAATLFKQRIAKLVSCSYGREVLKGIGGFGSLFEFEKDKWHKPVLVSSADGVGTKLAIARLVNKHDTIGIDCVAMNVNDILCVGAKPIFFLDYLAYSKIEQDILQEVVKGITKGCQDAGCALVGGETAQMPGMYKEGEYDIAGFCVGVVEKDFIIDGTKIDIKDRIIGLASTGLHSNGFSLVRKVLTTVEQKRMSNELLKSTRIYVKPVLETIRQFKQAVHGIAHITGGAFYDKIARILPVNLSAQIEKSSWTVPEIFRFIQLKGNIPEKEMYHTFNMGIGMVLIVSAEKSQQIMHFLAQFKIPCWEIGRIIKGKKTVDIV
ncbi:MAG: phosphoribosylformylglycinamidine cyclo-ligase [Candidatus Omnitrophica bacterium]|nr:phosphoribosylformylglycinamidine cyclo-ligase [Candidatus Omnitrophota bacterium]